MKILELAPVTPFDKNVKNKKVKVKRLTGEQQKK